MLGSGLTLLLWATSAQAFEPMPPIMQMLLEVFPEENGRFVDEPFGSTAEMPDEAKPLFETFRVVVPAVEDIDKNLAALFAASSRFPIKKIARYDKNPGAPGLAGFRGVWCQTEDDSQVGFSIVTINQNRFLIWAKMGYYPAYANDSINPKVRDQYARDVSQYLAGIDMKVPENDAPEAGGRGLPESMEFYPPPNQRTWNGWHVVDSVLRAERTIPAWGLEGVAGIIPTDQTVKRIISEAPDSIRFSNDMQFIQDDLQALVLGGHDISSHCSIGQSLPRGDYRFAVDRFGRLRMCTMPGEGDVGISIESLFPATGVLTVGTVATYGLNEASIKPVVYMYVTPYPSGYFYDMETAMSSEDVRHALHAELRSLGHFFAALSHLEIPIYRVLISEFRR